MLQDIINTALNRAVEYKKKRGIYFLIRDQKVIYIGQTTNFDERIQIHLRYRKFDKYYFHPIEDLSVDLDIIENNLIIAHDPKENTTINKARGYLTKKDIYRKHKVGKRFLDKNRDYIHKFKYGPFVLFCENDVLSCKSK